MKLLIDMNLSPRWVDLLAAAGFDATHWSTIGDKAALDADIMEFARQHACTVLTHDLDFSSILAATGGLKPSVIQIRADGPSPESIGLQVISAIRQMTGELENGALLTIEPQRARVRILPLI